MPLFDENGERIRGRQNQSAALQALAKVKVTLADDGPAGVFPGEWIVARVCSDYLQYCEQGASKGTVSSTHWKAAQAWLNDLCAFCGALPVAQLKKGHVTTWIEKHSTWRSTETHRSVISVVPAAFNRAEEMFGVTSPLKGLKKPAPKPRLQSISPEDEQTIYDNLEPQFRNFLFAAIHTGLRPFCELALLKAEHIERTPRGMMWRVYSTKTLGWLIIVAVRPLSQHVPLAGLMWLLGGGIAYSVVLAFFAAKQIPYCHFVWHLFVMAGTTCHFMAVWCYVI